MGITRHGSFLLFCVGSAETAGNFGTKHILSLGAVSVQALLLCQAIYRFLKRNANCQDKSDRIRTQFAFSPFSLYRHVMRAQRKSAAHSIFGEAIYRLIGKEVRYEKNIIYQCLRKTRFAYLFIGARGFEKIGRQNRGSKALR